MNGGGKGFEMAQAHVGYSESFALDEINQIIKVVDISLNGVWTVVALKLEVAHVATAKSIHLYSF